MKKDKTGLPPGALVYTGEKKIESPFLTVTRFNQETLEKSSEVPDPASATADHVMWLDIRGLHEIALFEEIAKRWKVHPLAMEDILDVSNQRPKFDEFDTGYLLILRNVVFDGETHTLKHEQLSIYTGPNYVFTFQEDADDSFRDVRARVEQSGGRIRSRSFDYLAYALADNVVDRYFIALDAIGEAIAQLEQDIVNDPQPETKSRIHQLKQCTLAFRRSLSPLREAINRYARHDSDLIQSSTEAYLRDLYDHVLMAAELNETYREALSGLHDLYVSELSFKMNNVMQVLTIIATIFIPLTFLAGIYGMNFSNMPELEWKYSYLTLIIVMIIITISLLMYFRRKKWL